MTKYWFVLDQTHYAAPVYKDETWREASGSLLLGHIVPDIKSLDHVVNRDELPCFPRNFRVEKSTQSNVRWSSHARSESIAGASVSAPALTGAGIGAGAEVNIGSTAGASDRWEFDQLETQLIAPTPSYIQDCISTPQVAAYVKQRKFLGKWKMYMISGIKIGKGAKFEQGVSRGKSGGSRPAINIAEVAKLEIGAECSRLTETTLAAQYDDAFIWAVRLLEISDSWFNSSIGLRTVAEGTILGLDTAQSTVNATVLVADLQDYRIVSSEPTEDDEEIMFRTIV